MKKIIVFIVLILIIIRIFPQIEIKIPPATDTMGVNLSYSLIKTGESGKVFFETRNVPQIYTADYTDTLRCIYEFRMSIKTVNDECICYCSDFEELFMADSAYTCNCTGRIHDLCAYIQNDFSRRLCYTGYFNGDVVFFCLPIEFIPLKKRNDE